MKRIIPLLLVLCFLLSGCAETWFLLSLIAENTEPSREEIFAYVLKNREYLEILLDEELPEDYEASKAFAQEHLSEESIVESISPETSTVVDFSCGGTGNVTNSTYTGFYYSGDDTPYPMVFDTQTLVETAPGVYHWENENGSHITHSERICENWFYYHVTWH